MSEQEFADFEIEQDFNDVKEFGGGGFDLVAPGRYPMDVIHIEQKPSKKSGTPMVVVTFKIPEDHDAHPGAQLWGNYSLSPKALGRLKQLMMAANCSLDKFRASELMGARIEADVIHNEGDAQVGQDGNPMPVKTFANVVNESPIGGFPDAEVKPEAKADTKKPAAAAAAKPGDKPKTAPPPAAAKPAANNATGGTRRA